MPIPPLSLSVRHPLLFPILQGTGHKSLTESSRIRLVGRRPLGKFPNVGSISGRRLNKVY